MNRDAPATQGDLFDVRDELRDDMRELRDELRGDLREMETRLNRNIADASGHALNVAASVADGRMRAAEERLRTDIGRSAQVVIEAVASQIRALDDRYRDLPDRVGNLEHRVDRLERDDRDR